MTENKRFDMDKDIQYPDEEQIRSEIKAIMDRGLPERQNFCRRSVQIFTGPGLDVIFYRAKLIFLGSFLICLFLSQLCLMIGNFTEYSEYLVLMMYPLLHLIFHGLSCWAEEQSEVIELKMSFHYSFSYIVALRMFYVSMFSAGVNFLATAMLVEDAYRSKICAAGLSSMFLLAVLALVLYDRFRGRTYYIWGIAGAWVVLCLILSGCGKNVSIFIFDVMPLAVHVLIAIVSFALFIHYIGKDGREYAYTFECQ